MREGHAGEYQYSIDRDLAGAGRTVWRWTVSRRDSDVALASGTSIRSEDDASAAALRAIEQLRVKSVASSSRPTAALHGAADLKFHTRRPPTRRRTSN